MNTSPKTFAIMTLGCRINFYESQSVRERFLSLGYREVPFLAGARVMLVHSCAVTAQSERKSRSYLFRALRQKEERGGIVALFGCMGQKRREELKAAYPNLDLIWGNADLSGLVSACDEMCAQLSSFSIPHTYDTPKISRWYSPRAFVKIQDGCDQFCTYCIVPYLRGRERNRETQEILEEVHMLAESGAREIVLTGIETASFGADNLCALADEIAGEEKIRRIRFGSLKPSVFTKAFCARLLSNPKVMPQFHLSVQSAADSVLRAMRRPYSEKELSQSVENLYDTRADLALTADIICGFPGESEADYQKTRKFVSDARLLHAHIFPYSRREGTLAAKLPDQIPETEKRRRASDLGLHAEKVAKARFTELLPLENEILIEKIAAKSLSGHSEHFLPLVLKADPGDAVGRFKTIKPDEVL